MNAARFFTQTATREVPAGGNSYDGKTYGTPSTIRVRWFVEHELIRTAEGTEVTTAARISTTDDVWLGDRITDSHGRQYRVVQVRTNRDTSGGFSHYVAWLA